jgi:hypothetical protein
MSFFDSLKSMAGGLLGNATPEDASQAVSAHVGSMEPSELAGHLTQSVSNLDPSSLQGLGQQLLATFTNHPAYSGDGAQAAQEAGTTEEAVASGSPSAISSIIAYAKSNPQVLQAATSAFMERNPAALEQMAPGLVQGIMQRVTAK